MEVAIKHSNSTLAIDVNAHKREQKTQADTPRSAHRIETRRKTCTSIDHVATAAQHFCLHCSDVNFLCSAWCIGRISAQHCLLCLCYARLCMVAGEFRRKYEQRKISIHSPKRKHTLSIKTKQRTCDAFVGYNSVM